MVSRCCQSFIMFLFYFQRFGGSCHSFSFFFFNLGIQLINIQYVEIVEAKCLAAVRRPRVRFLTLGPQSVSLLYGTPGFDSRPSTETLHKFSMATKNNRILCWFPGHWECYNKVYLKKGWELLLSLLKDGNHIVPSLLCSKCFRGTVFRNFFNGIKISIKFNVFPYPLN